MSEEAVVVETRELTKHYGDGQLVVALEGVNLTVRRGEFVAIVGPSGSGKSTLLNMIGALDRPTRGEVIIDGTPLARVKDLDRFRSQAVGFIFQTHNLIPTLNARENVEVPMYESKLSGGKRHERAVGLLGLVGLGDRQEALPNQLSGGQRQRVAIARALANNPALILADEPTGNLDSKTTTEILELLDDLNRRQHATLIVVTHNAQVARAARRVVTIRDGRVQRDIAAADTLAQDLADFKNSGLGQAILGGRALPDDLRACGPALRELLEKA